MKKLIIIYATMDTGLADRTIEEKPALRHIIDHCLRANYPVVVATTNRAVDNPIEEIAGGVKCYRYSGDKNDVLGCFHWIGEQRGMKGGDLIVMVTADSMGIDSTTIHEVFIKLKDNDYVCASDECGYPPGYGCEGFTFHALHDAHRRADSLYDRKNVTPFIQRSHTWPVWRVKRYDGFNLEMNTEEDYQRVKNIYAHRPE